MTSCSSWAILTSIFHSLLFLESHNSNIMDPLAASCKEDCDKLLKIVGKLTSDGSKRRWKSFKVAVSSLRKQDEIAMLEKRVSRTQSTLTLCICEIAKYNISENLSS